jgi:hypothetical protein
MTKKKIALTVLALALVVAGTLAFVFLPRLLPRSTYTGALPAGATQTQADAAILSKTDTKLAKQAASSSNSDDESRTALLKDYKKAQVLHNGDATYFDLTTADKQRVIIEVQDGGKTLRKYLREENLLLLNEDNRDMRVIPDNFQKNVNAADLPQIDPFKDNPNGLEQFEKKETSKTKADGLFESVGYSGAQTLAIYETQNGFVTTSAKGTVFPAGTSLATIALVQKLALQTLLDCTTEDALTADTVFITFKRQNFHHERDVTVTNPLPPFGGAETYIYSVSGSGIVELNYRTPNLVNSAKDIVAANIMSKPSSMEYCDEYHFDAARRQLSSRLNMDEPDFTLWADYSVEGDE